MIINLTYTPQRSDYKAEYIVNNDTLVVRIDNIEEIFDFTGLEEGIAEEIIVEYLPIHPIESAKKSNDGVINIVARKFYGEDEKEVVEDGSN